MLNGKKIIPGIIGSIAAYKACYIIHDLIKQGAEVQVVITPAGKEFITSITLSVLTSKPVISEFFTQRDGTWNGHVDLGLWADAMLVAPTTASTIGKIASGIADSMPITTYLSAKAPVFIAPAMDLDMFARPSTQKNPDALRSYGNHIIRPASGELASHLVGRGRMEKLENIIRVLNGFFSSTSESTGKKMLITTGPTYEKIDPARFIGNHSSDEMGFALAEERARCGVEVVLITGPVQQKVYHSHITRIDVESAQEIYKVTTAQYTLVDTGILCAAATDFVPDVITDGKIRREGNDLMLHLKPTYDITAALGKLKIPGQKLTGLVLETNDEQRNTEGKLIRKSFDFIVLNSLNDADAGFHYDTNKISILSCRSRTDYPLKSETEVAKDIIDRMIKEL